MSRTSIQVLPWALAACLAVPLITTEMSAAHADVDVRVDGNVKVRGSVKIRVGSDRRVKRVRVKQRRHRSHRTPRTTVRLRIGGGIYWGGGVVVDRGFAQPPPPPPVHSDCNCLVSPPPPPVHGYAAPPPPPPAYYHAPPPTVAVSAAPARRPLPRLGIGVFAGGMQLSDRAEGEDFGVFGRLRLTERWSIEAEIAHTEIADTREDRRVGGTLIFDTRPRSRWSLQLLGGSGITAVDLGDGEWEAQQSYGELGVGLTYRVTPRFHLAGDLRFGGREAVDSSPEDTDLKAVAPSSEDREEYNRGRVSAILYF
ncbi:MAG: hypothetical protein AAGC55_21180 [Myxococcota bacterium]